ncbi:MAG: ECF transporter S component [Clostridiaceae bacterium]|uniref:ECF transporter S component n=1 Tax=Anaerosalibacter bizertensis TaxID=932217 RepID=A0A9Q4ABG8_9FIRM|nr:ECF transporter S component [Anaerosalibacter bizertensis]MBV1817074.1 ECF transporter S component [Bacteroidales bacterium MSK.15.36]MBW4828328.1 ECF transporter S component [Clostridiaceae bacterium]HHV25648.1 ECF transporter S component [Tissierellia bacterium]MBW4859946.1 ECF transporter S component [Clostridiaceae bacterium]MBW4869330.1 ECF transporter S component [Clostridiaceae bacterium]
MRNKKINYFIIMILIPLSIALGVILFKDRKYNLISIIIAFLSCLPIFFSFEKGKTSTRKMTILSVMVAISVAGRFVFAAIPGFKPVTAIVVITAIYFGSEAGFLTGSLSAIISNIYFGQGPWTPFQMFSWGMLGLIAGLPFMRKLLLKNKIILAIYGVFAGVIYSLMMDVWTVLAMDGVFNAKRYIAAVTTALPVMAIYAVSNVVFLMLAIKPFGEKLERIKTKYGI